MIQLGLLQQQDEEYYQGLGDIPFCEVLGCSVCHLIFYPVVTSTETTHTGSITPKGGGSRHLLRAPVNNGK